MSPPEITRGFASLCARVFSNTKTRNQLKAFSRSLCSEDHTRPPYCNRTQIPWKESHETRSVVAHDYFKVDVDLVWATVKGDLPGLRRDIQVLLYDLKDQAGLNTSRPHE